MPSIEDQIDALYQLPLGSFTAARNALARTVKGDLAQRVKTLPKAASIPWAVNQLYWRGRRVYDRLMQAGAKLRKAQLAALGGAPRDLQSLTLAHRTALADAVREASRIAQGAGARPEAEPLARMLEALSLSVEQEAQPGRLIATVHPAGFEALAGVVAVGSTHSAASDAGPPGAPPASSTAQASTARSPAHDRSARDVRERAKAEREEAAHREKQRAAARSLAEATVRTLTRAAEAARAEESRARQAFDRAHEATVLAEHDLLEAEARLAAIEQTHRR